MKEVLIVLVSGIGICFIDPPSKNKLWVVLRYCAFVIADGICLVCGQKHNNTFTNYAGS